MLNNLKEVFAVRIFSVLFVLFFSLPLFAAEDFTVWDSQTFSAPYPSNVIAVSSEFSNNNGLNSIKIVVEYEAITPKPCNCQLDVVIEEEITSGVWVTLAAQHQVISSDDNAPTRIIIASPHFVSNPGVDDFIAVGEGIRVSNTDAVAPSKFRIVLYNNDTGSTDLLSSVTITAHGRKFDR